MQALVVFYIVSRCFYSIFFLLRLRSALSAYNRGAEVWYDPYRGKEIDRTMLKWTIRDFADPYFMFAPAIPLVGELHFFLLVHGHIKRLELPERFEKWMFKILTKEDF